MVQLYDVVMEEWKDENRHWAEMQYNTDKLSQHIKILKGTESSSYHIYIPLRVKAKFQRFFWIMKR